MQRVVLAESGAGRLRDADFAAGEGVREGEGVEGDGRGSPGGYGDGGRADIGVVDGQGDFGCDSVSPVLTSRAETVTRSRFPADWRPSSRSVRATLAAPSSPMTTGSIVTPAGSVASGSGRPPGALEVADDHDALAGQL